MRRVVLVRKTPILLVFFLLFFLPACSMQSSGSKLESARLSQDAKSAEVAPKETVSEGELTLTVDYLTPLAKIQEPELFVYKEKRRLYVVHHKTLVRDYPIGLGFHPQGDKEKEGDGRTPEGEFFVCMKNAGSRFGKSMGLNYPSKKHAERAFFAGVISPVDFREILLAVEKKGKPPWNTVLGGEIFIHAGGAHKDWTNGCVALYDSDMEELFQMASTGTPVSIRP